jgi:hypothetical protein
MQYPAPIIACEPMKYPYMSPNKDYSFPNNKID